jgi:TonB family protein
MLRLRSVVAKRVAFGLAIVVCVGSHSANAVQAPSAERTPSGTGDNMGGLFFDPQGADFTVWIDQFKSEVHRNWIVPQQALTGFKGHVDYEFTVERGGSLSALRLLKSSGTPSLDRAAQNALQGSRFLPLPADYGPRRITMQVSFLYNEDPSDRTIQDYDRAIRLKSDDAEAFNNRRTAYTRKKDYDRAIQDYNEAIRLKPDYAEAFNNRCWAYNGKKGYDRAVQDCDQAIRLKSDYAEAFRHRGFAYAHVKDYDRAILDYDQAIRLKPDVASASRARGVTRFYLQQFAAAQQDLSNAHRLDPSDSYTVLWLYLAEARNGQPAAKEDLEKNSAAIKPTSWPAPLIKLYLGTASSSDVLASAEHLDAQKDKEQHCQAAFFLGEAALLRGVKADAVHLFRDSLATGVASFWEYLGAQAELDRLRP